MLLSAIRGVPYTNTRVIYIKYDISTVHDIGWVCVIIIIIIFGQESQQNRFVYIRYRWNKSTRTFIRWQSVNREKSSRCNGHVFGYSLPTTRVYYRVIYNVICTTR